MIPPRIQRRIERRVESTIGRKGAAYQGAVESVFAILIAVGIGYWIDERFDTSPIGLFSGVVLGFVAFVLRLMRLRRLLEAPPED